jgi:hypothetical protein
MRVIQSLAYTLSNLSKEKLGWLAAGLLVSVQCSIAIAFKFSQSGGHYPFSQASSLTLTEALKFLLSACFYAYELRTRESSPRLATTDDQRHLLADSPEEPTEKFGSWSSPYQPASRRTPLLAFFHQWRSELDRRAVFGFTLLGILYAANNHAVSFTDHVGRNH